MTVYLYIMKTYFLQLFNYDLWASKTLLDKFELQYPVNPRINELMSHLCSTQRIWLDRCTGVQETVPRFMDRLPGQIRSDTEMNHHAWKDFINNLQPADFERRVSYVNFRGDHLEDNITDILTHVVNHGTHHRGSVVMLMKEEGYTLPALDYIFYKRQL